MLESIPNEMDRLGSIAAFIRENGYTGTIPDKLRVDGQVLVTQDSGSERLGRVTEISSDGHYTVLLASGVSQRVSLVNIESTDVYLQDPTHPVLCCKHHILEAAKLGKSDEVQQAIQTKLNNLWGYQEGGAICCKVCGKK